MPNGKPGDHPMTDIVVHRRDVYSPAVSSLVREIAAMADDKTRRALGDLLFTKYNEYSRPNVAELELYLRDLRDQLASDAKQRGFEIPKK
jgi:hypothetical protein